MYRSSSSVNRADWLAGSHVSWPVWTPFAGSGSELWTWRLQQLSDFTHTRTNAAFLWSSLARQTLWWSSSNGRFLQMSSTVFEPSVGDPRVHSVTFDFSTRSSGGHVDVKCFTSITSVCVHEFLLQKKDSVIYVLQGPLHVMDWDPWTPGEYQLVTWSFPSWRVWQASPERSQDVACMNRRWLQNNFSVGCTSEFNKKLLCLKSEFRQN